MAVIRVPFATRNRTVSSPRCTLVDSEESFRQLLRVLEVHSLIAFDTESNNFHSYNPRICLVQFAVHRTLRSDGFGSSLIFLLDPDRIDLRRLRTIFEDPDKTFIIHSATNDLGQLWQEFGLSIASVFDTQVAARMLGMHRTSLTSLLESQFGVEQSKKPQNSDWGRRPFSPSQLKYACQDVAFLGPLYRTLLHALRIRNQVPEAMDIMQEIVRRDYSRFGSPIKVFWDHRATKRVPLALMNVYRSLWNWREEVARAADCPRFKILGDKALLVLTREQPTDSIALKQTQCLTATEFRRYGPELLEAIGRGKNERVPLRPPVKTLDTDTKTQAGQQANLFAELRKWRFATSRARGLDPDIILSKYALEVISEDAPMTVEALAKQNLLGEWKLQQYGRELVRIVRAIALGS